MADPEKPAARSAPMAGDLTADAIEAIMWGLTNDLFPQPIKGEYHQLSARRYAEAHRPGAKLALQALLSLLDARGFVVAPKVATLSHALEAHKIRGSVCRTSGMYEAIYAAMLAASPSPFKDPADGR